MLKEENVKGNSLQEFRKRQYEEALLRMGLLNLDKHCIKAFQNGEVWESEGKGSLYELDENEKQMVKEFEEDHRNCLVYHLIHNRFEFGECYTFLYISDDEVEWETDKEDIVCGYAFSYVKNVNDDSCSEFGSVGIRPLYGGVIRVS